MVSLLLTRSIGARAVLRISTRFLGLLLAALLASGRAWAGDVGYIRDAEIESTLRAFYTPILQAAGLEPSAVHIYIVNDPRLNSFVADVDVHGRGLEARCLQDGRIKGPKRA